MRFRRRFQSRRAKFKLDFSNSRNAEKEKTQKSIEKSRFQLGRAQGSISRISKRHCMSDKRAVKRGLSKPRSRGSRIAFYADYQFSFF
jgi:hypothetical protein